jgi:hypothetical protein
MTARRGHISDAGTDRPGARIISTSITHCYYLSSINFKLFVWCELMEDARGGSVAA